MNYFFERITSTDEQIKILYELLKIRNYVISHRSLPSFETHRDFVKNHPYIDWFLISDELNYLGSFYLKKDNSIGLNLTEYSKNNLKACVGFISDNFTPRESEPSMVPNYFYLNISYSNKKALNALQELGLNPLQISLRMDK
jgi:hypothetical protein